MSLRDNVLENALKSEGCLICGLLPNNEMHDFRNVWFDHYFSRGDVEKLLVQKMADQIRDEVDSKILSDLFWQAKTAPVKMTYKWKMHPLSYMTDLSDCQNESVELHPKEKSILPDRFVCVSMGPKDYDDPWDPHPFGLEDEPWHETDLRQIRFNEKYHEHLRRKKLPWLARLLSRW
jgi:hypothetical protein